MIEDGFWCRAPQRSNAQQGRGEVQSPEGQSGSYALILNTAGTNTEMLQIVNAGKSCFLEVGFLYNIFYIFRFPFATDLCDF